MAHLITCECGQSLRVSRSQAGQELECGCGKKLKVPTLRGLAELPIAPDTSIAELPSSRATWGGGLGTMLAISVALFALSAIPCAYFTLQRMSLDPSYTVESEIEAGNKDFDIQDMEHLAANWLSFETSGLGEKQKPDFYYYNRFAKERESLAITSGSLAGLFALIALGIWFTAKKRTR